MFTVQRIGDERLDISVSGKLGDPFQFSRAFTHAAVRADNWARALSSIKSKLIPDLVSTSVSKDQRYQAASWLESV